MTLIKYHFPAEVNLCGNLVHLQLDKRPTTTQQNYGNVLQETMPMSRVQTFYGKDIQLTTFKRFQLDAIRAVERKKDVVVVQKTGSGKSICFQLPSLFEKTKPMVVICPTLSLINSKVESLKEFGINAVAVGPQHPVETLNFGVESGDLPSRYILRQNTLLRSKLI